MLAFIRHKLSSGLVKNYFYLSTYQVVNFLVPLIIFPIIIQKVGIGNFGKVAFSYALVNYFNILTDYGFNLSATRSIAINKDDVAATRRIYTSVMAAKSLLFLLSFLLFGCLFFIPFFRADYQLHLLSFTAVAAQFLMPVWLFQGMEDMRFLAFFNGLAKIIFAGLVVLFVQLPEQYVLVNLLQGIGGIVAALGCHWVAGRKYRMRFVGITVADIRRDLREGLPLFFSSLAVNIYVVSNVFILGIFASPVLVGYYSVAEKVYFAIKQFPNVFSQVIFPKVCRLAAVSMQELRNFQQRIFVPFVSCLFLACLAVFIMADYIVAYFLGESVPDVLVMIRMFCLAPLIVAFDIPPFQALLALNERYRYSVVLISGCVLNLICNLVFARAYGPIGTVSAVLITELYITVGLSVMFRQVLHQKILTGT